MQRTPSCAFFLQSIMFSQRYSKLLSACTSCTRRANTSSRTHAAYSNWHLHAVEKATAVDANHGIFRNGTGLFVIPLRSAIASSREFVTLNRAPTIQTRFSQELISHNAHVVCRHPGASLRCISSRVSSSTDVGHGGAVHIVSGSSAKVEDAASVRVSQGRFQEEVAQSSDHDSAQVAQPSDHDSAQIDLGKLISSPSELKGLHASLKTSLRSSGDKQIMSMTIEDIQNILKGEIKRRASQTASVEIWKALLIVGGLIFVLYVPPIPNTQTAHQY
jgi:hypothetical protein